MRIYLGERNPRIANSRRTIMIAKGREAATKILSARKSRLLSSVGAFGLVALVVGAGPYQSAVGAPTEAAQTIQPGGFADLVAKVKPAVISVRVKMDQSEIKSSMSESEGQRTAPLAEGPLEKFFQQFNESGNGPRHR